MLPFNLSRHAADLKAWMMVSFSTAVNSILSPITDLKPHDGPYGPMYGNMLGYAAICASNRTISAILVRGDASAVQVGFGAEEAGMADIRGHGEADGVGRVFNQPALGRRPVEIDTIGAPVGSQLFGARHGDRSFRRDGFETDHNTEKPEKPIGKEHFVEARGGPLSAPFGA